MKSKGIIIGALKREESKERGLKITNPNNDLSDSHIEKAKHNLQAMDDLTRLGHSDWVVVVAYYAMYHAATSILALVGLESKDHATTVAILEYFFSKHIDKALLLKFNELKMKKENIEKLHIEDKFLDYLWSAKTLRENAQYGTNTFIPQSDETLKKAKEFVITLRTLKNNVSEEYIKIVQTIMKKLNEKIIA